VQLEIYNLIAAAEKWWDEPLDWSAAADGNKVFRKDRQEGRV